MNKQGAAVRKKVEAKVLAVLAEFIPVWTDQHKALGRIMDIVSPDDIPTMRLEMEEAVGEIMEWDAVLNRGRIQGLAGLLLGQHYSPAVLKRAYKRSPDSPWGRDWRSEGGTKPPSERGLRDTIASLTKGEGGAVVDLDA